MGNISCLGKHLLNNRSVAEPYLSKMHEPQADISENTFLWRIIAVIQGVVLEKVENRFAVLEIITRRGNMRPVVMGVATCLTGVRKKYLSSP
jgi:hypothetical protein